MKAIKEFRHLGETLEHCRSPYGTATAEAEIFHLKEAFLSFHHRRRRRLTAFSGLEGIANLRPERRNSQVMSPSPPSLALEAIERAWL
jgi:hypothetical protein